jgi:hypothetical protein
LGQERRKVQIFHTILDLIAMRSFSNLWYWIALAVTWSSASHWVLGVPYDMVLRARRVGGQAQEDLVLLARLNVARLLNIAREAGLILAIMVPFGLTFLLVTGFFYGSELAQAVFLLIFPLSGVGLLSLRTAARLEPIVAEGDATLVDRILSRHRISVQAIGMVAITCTALWGMWQNLKFSVLG